jgi:hypothetical protein
MAIVAGQMGQMQLSNYFLDQFVAHKLSSLTECGVPELSMGSAWLNDFILNSAFRMTLPAEKRAYAFNIIRRTEGAFSAYREARLALIEYVTTPRNTVSPYFRSLSNFEVCISQFWQCCEIVMRAAAPIKLFKSGDNSDTERLYNLYIDAKHMDGVIHRGELPAAATTGLWITNQGLESTKAPSGVSFTELVENLISMGELAGKLSQLELPDSNLSFSPDGESYGR